MYVHIYSFIYIHVHTHIHIFCSLAKSLSITHFHTHSRTHTHIHTHTAPKLWWIVNRPLLQTLIVSNIPIHEWSKSVRFPVMCRHIRAKIRQIAAAGGSCIRLPPRRGESSNLRTHTHTHTQTHTHTHTRTRIHTHTHVHVHIQKHTHTHTYTHTHTNSHIFTHTHTCPRTRPWIFWHDSQGKYPLCTIHRKIILYARLCMIHRGNNIAFLHNSQYFGMVYVTYIYPPDPMKYAKMCISAWFIGKLYGISTGMALKYVYMFWCDL